MKKYLFNTGIALLGIALIFSSCINSDYTPPDYDAILQNNLDAVDKTQLTKDKAHIDDSLFNNWKYTNVQIDPMGGVRYRVTTLGTGVKPTLTSNILIRYKGMLLDSGRNSTPFDQNQSPTEFFPLYNLIAGMQTAMQLIPEGSVVTLYIPSGLGYGPYDRINPTTNKIVIPKNSNLIFELTLLQVNNP